MKAKEVMKILGIKAKCKYRFSIEDAVKAHQNSFSSKNYTKSFTKIICFD